MLATGWPSVVLPIVILLVLILMEVPIAFALAGAGAIGLLLRGGFNFATVTLGTVPYNITVEYALIIIPMFVLMGTLIANSGMLNAMFDLAQRAVGRFPGGLAISTIIACTFFGGITGSSVADAATFGRLSVSEMSARGYERGYAAAVVASASTVAVLIPPSITLVIYGILTQLSVNRLLLSGILPGLITAAAYTTTVIVLARRREGCREYQLERMASNERRTPIGLVHHYFGALAAAGLFVIVIGGIYSGVYTATEAGAAGATAALLFSLAYLAVARLAGAAAVPLTQFASKALREAASLTGMVFALLIGAAIFTQFLVLARVPDTLARWVTEAHLPPRLVLAILLLIMIPLGMVMEGLSLLLVVVPIVFPVVISLGFDGVWFGVLMVKIIEIGLIAPPLGLNVYAVSGLVPGLRSGDVFRRIPPFILAEFAVMLIIFFFPEITSLIPDLSGAH